MTLNTSIVAALCPVMFTVTFMIDWPLDPRSSITGHKLAPGVGVTQEDVTHCNRDVSRDSHCYIFTNQTVCHGPGIVGLAPKSVRLAPNRTNLIYFFSAFRTKVGQIGPKWNKSGTFSDQISVQFS